MIVSNSERSVATEISLQFLCADKDVGDSDDTEAEADVDADVEILPGITAAISEVTVAVLPHNFKGDVEFSSFLESDEDDLILSSEFDAVNGIRA